MDKPRLFTTSSRQWRVLKPAARAMRHELTPAESRLWSAIRGGRLGVRFRRQHAVGRFVVDFFGTQAGLVIEVDGASHDGRERYDAERDAELKARGLRVLRFSNERVLHDLDGVLGEIVEALGPHPPAPSP